jgi:uncharacterized membrane protein
MSKRKSDEHPTATITSTKLAYTSDTSIEVLQQSTAHMGPLPPPEMLAEYERIHPGMSAALLDMVKEQSRHRREIEKMSAWRPYFGMTTGFLVTVMAFGIAFYAIRAGESAAAVIAALVALAPVVGAFISGRSSEARRHEAEK